MKPKEIARRYLPTNCFVHKKRLMKSIVTTLYLMIAKIITFLSVQSTNSVADTKVWWANGPV